MIRSFRGRRARPGQPARVYRNLHHGGYSVMQPGRDGWRVVGHTDDVSLRDCRFVVREGGRRRAIRSGRKNVHAFVEGTLERVGHEELVDCSGQPRLRVARYDMRRTGRFQVMVGGGAWDPIDAARVVLLDSSGMLVVPA